MITIRKLLSLKEGTRRRKYPLILQGFEVDIKKGTALNRVYLSDLVRLIEKDPYCSKDIREKLAPLLNIDWEDQDLLRPINSLRYSLLSAIGAEPGDWDFDETGRQDRKMRISGDLNLYLDGLRSPFNVGSIFRSAESFGIAHIYLSSDCASPEHRRAIRTSMGCISIIPWSYTRVEDLPRPLFSLELGGKSAEEFPFPESGTLVIGSEELGVSPEALKASDRGLGRLTIRTGGSKGSINVSVATGIALHRWFSSCFTP